MATNEDAFSLEDRRSFIKKAAAAAVVSGFAVRGLGQDAAAAPAAVYPLGVTLKGEFTLAAVGDIIATHPMMIEIERDSPQLLELLKADIIPGETIISQVFGLAQLGEAMHLCRDDKSGTVKVVVKP